MKQEIKKTNKRLLMLIVVLIVLLIILISMGMLSFLNKDKIKSDCSSKAVGAKLLSEIFEEKIKSPQRTEMMQALGARKIIEELRKEGENPDDFYTEVRSVVEKSGLDGYVISFSVSHKDDFKPQNCRKIGNPSGKSRNMVYDTNQDKIIVNELWQ